MSSQSGTETPGKLGAFPFVIGGISFVPLIGIPFGIAAIVWGLLTKKTGARKLILTGALGSVSTFIVYGGLFYFGEIERGGVFDNLRSRMAQMDLNQLVPAVEFYKLQHGQYPESLQQLHDSLPKDSIVPIYDSTLQSLNHPREFFYERVDNGHYYLRGVGPDGQPFSDDDLLPEVDPGTRSRLGLLLDRQQNRP